MMRDSLKYWAGAVLATFVPHRHQRVCANFTLPYFADTRWQTGDQWIRHFVGQQRRRQSNQLEQLHKTFWQQQGPGGWHSATANRLEELYIPTFGSLVQDLAVLIDRHRIQAVVEFGTGTGDWLAYLRSQWSTPQNFLGLDLAEAQISQNRQRYPDLEFAATDLVEWVEHHSSERSLFLTHCGVFEYLSEATLRKVLSTLNRNNRESLLLLVEPVAEDFDLSSERSSRALGSEFSYSHNYFYHLLQAGWQVHRNDEQRLEGFRMLSFVAGNAVQESPAV
jgi:hypothetical protein